MGLGIRNDDVAERREGRLDVSGDARVESGENQRARDGRRALQDLHPRKALGKRCGLQPVGRVSISFSRRAVGRGECLDVEPRVLVEKRQEPLADRTGRSEDSDGDLVS